MGWIGVKKGMLVFFVVLVVLLLIVCWELKEKKVIVLMEVFFKVEEMNEKMSEIIDKINE